MHTAIIIDDSKTSRSVLRTILEKNGYEIVAEAANGEEGFEKYCDLHPDFVTTSCGTENEYSLFPIYRITAAFTPVSSKTSLRAVSTCFSPASTVPFGMTQPSYLFLKFLYNNNIFPLKITTPPQLVASIMAFPPIWCVF